MKYIDAEKLIALIDAKLEDLGMSGSIWVGRSVLQELKNDIITSLQQEQSEVELEKESDIMAMKLFNEFFPQDGDTITPNDFCKGLRSFARHFADWQKERDFNDFARLKKSWYEEGRIHGKFEGLSDDEKYQQGFHDAKEQMMKDAIE